MSDDYIGKDATRALQESKAIREQNHVKLLEMGPYNLLKVSGEPWTGPRVTGYITLLPAISGHTPAEMELILGLRANQLSKGAWVYRLGRVPAINEFLPRGYTTLVDGLRLRDDLAHDTAGFRPGHGAFQVVLIKPVEATLAAVLRPGERFQPGLHPRYRR